MAKNPCGKTRPVEDPYEVWRTLDGTWEWRVLKKNQSPEREAIDKYASWFCAVYSPYLAPGSYELGDTYVKEIRGCAYKVGAEKPPEPKSAIEVIEDLIREVV